MRPSSNDRDRAIFVARCRDGKTLQTIADEHGLSLERIRQIVRRGWRRRDVCRAVLVRSGATALNGLSPPEVAEGLLSMLIDNPETPTVVLELAGMLFQNLKQDRD